MHELSIALAILDQVRDAADGARVLRVVLEVGQLTAVLPDALQLSWTLACNGTSLEGARLEIDERPGRARCLDCEATLVLERPYGTCACGSTRLEWLAGDELKTP